MDKRKFFREEIQMAQEDLKDLETYIEAFYNFLPLSIVVVTPVGIIININKAFEGLTGFKSLEIVGQPISSIFSEKKKTRKIEEKIRQEKTIKAAELSLLSKDKKKIPVRVSASPRKDREGNFIGYFLGITNISGLKKRQEELEEEIKKRTKELRERIEELEKFHKLTIGRELKVTELREEATKLKEKLEKLKDWK